MTDQRRVLQRVVGPVWRRLRLLLSRGVLVLVDDALKLQRVQVTLLGDAPAWAERFQQYGYTSHPLPGAEAIVASISGARAHLVALAVDDRRYRLVGLAEGEVALYDDQGQSVHLTRAGIVIDGAGKPVTITNAPKVRAETELLECTGEIRDRCDSGGRAMSEMRETYDDHDHPGDSGGTTGKPNQGMG